MKIINVLNQYILLKAWIITLRQKPGFPPTNFAVLGSMA
jgi:hypothetical protein